ncbi:MAG: SPOR domain-containing protein [Methylotenera sp.]|nr:MAG: SPOR domain-containing protein [Methylotenera sp.]PPD17843.1 MAG: SPOR domain-containing protein [Methylotenera sp.]
MQKDAPNDQELTLKKRARRRLVGAVALVLLMIIVLPMILKDRTVTAPTEEVTITLSNQNQTSELPAQSDFDSNVIPADVLPTEVPPLNSESIIDEPLGAAQEIPIEPKTASVKPKTEALTTADKKNANSPKFYVQIGVFSDEANVKQLQSKLTDLGYSSQTEKIDTAKGKKIRLRTHLLGERNEAAIALQNIKDAGLTGMVVSQ